MVSRISKLAVLVMFCTVGIGSSTRVSAEFEECIGKWEPRLQWNMLAIHMILLKDGKVLCVYDRFAYGVNRFLLFNPATQQTQLITSRPIDQVSGLPFRIFCSGHSQLPDGRIVFVGGGLFIGRHKHTVIFDPDAASTSCTTQGECMAFMGGCNTIDQLCDPWQVMDDMPDVGPAGDEDGLRWYPTVTTLGDGTVLVVAGDEETSSLHTADIPLIFNSSRPALGQYSQLGNAELHLPYYPFNFLLSDGTVIYAGSDFAIIEESPGVPSYERFSRRLDLSAQTWTPLDEIVADPIKGGSAVMYGPDLIMKGGGYDVGSTGIKEVYTLDMTSPTPTWMPFASLNHARKEHYLVALPGGKLLAIGGDQDPSPPNSGEPLLAVLVPEIHNDPSNPMLAWEEMALMEPTEKRCGATQAVCLTDDDCRSCTDVNCVAPGAPKACPAGVCVEGGNLGDWCVDFDNVVCVTDTDCSGVTTCESVDKCYEIPRAHHSSALLLPDARVLFAGGDICLINHAAENTDAQIFKPPYLFTSGGGAPMRPCIDEVDGRGSCDFPAMDIIAYGETFTVKFLVVPSIDAVNLIALGAATHSFDQSQRFLDLSFTTLPSGLLSVTAPATPEEAPSGYYMLFILDDNGVPSVAKIIKLDLTCPPALPPTVAPAPHDTLKNRYLSFVPNNEGAVAFKLTLVPVPPLRAPPSWWVDTPVLVDGSYISVLTDNPVYRRWDSTSVVHIGDCPVVPVNEYKLRATIDDLTFSAPLELSTIKRPGTNWWGDVVGFFNGDSWTPPQETTNIDDAVATIQGFQKLSTAPPMTWVDVDPEVTNRIVNFNDVLMVLSAFAGDEYPFNGPACP